MNRQDEYEEDNIYENTDDMLDTATGEDEQMGIMSTEAWNSIYNLYMQGWTVREISKRFGILPIRTKFIIWARARLYSEALPKFGAQYLLYTYHLEEEDAQELGVCDYGLDLDQLQVGDSYSEITAWMNDRVDAQRTPQQYTECLRRLEKKKPRVVGRYDRVQVGEHG